ncbi:hypothetical protein EQG49_00325 [Periweissella cryptocerci]|uniref:Ribbon-helix-helix protein, CopG family n=1 Tax=Periweissella cryptocerci TaxID=2506420 RepID=A0A4P6YQV7_9LACO|nr:hypothetical protein [Periweissella cryptocerci]QBO35000.1 hypothetical protein EQG49_00325 [Periweissella cryptocerci]
MNSFKILNVPDAINDKLTRYAENDGISRSELVRNILDDYVVLREHQLADKVLGSNLQELIIQINKLTQQDNNLYELIEQAMVKLLSENSNVNY